MMWCAELVAIAAPPPDAVARVASWLAAAGVAPTVAPRGDRVEFNATVAQVGGGCVRGIDVVGTGFQQHHLTVRIFADARCDDGSGRARPDHHQRIGRYADGVVCGAIFPAWLHRRSVSTPSVL